MLNIALHFQDLVIYILEMIIIKYIRTEGERELDFTKDQILCSIESSIDN